MTLRFYIDDSGKDDPPVFVLGGVALDTDRVAAFEAAWQAVLAAPPVMAYLKMRDARRCNNAFKGMSFAQRDAKLAALGEVIRAHAVATVAVIVRHADYARVYSGRMMSSIDRPYQMMFHLAIATAYRLCREHGFADQAEFVFDRQTGEEEELRDSYPAFRKNMDPTLAAFLPGNPRHADDKVEVALQAADMVAWHVRRSWHDGTETFIRASTAGPAIASLPRKHDLFDEPALRYIAQIATGTVRKLRTVFPYEAEQMAEQFDGMATVANLHLIASARPFQPVELISFPAIGTGKFQLVHNCAALDSPHLHRRSGNKCLGAVSAA